METLPDKPVSKSAVKAAEEILRRRSARRDLVAWARLCGYEPAAHHLLILQKLHEAVHGDIRRLALFLPPGSAKSTYASVLFPPWYLAQHPQTTILACSHSADLAEAFGRRNRNLISDNGKVLGYDLTTDSQAAGKWATTTGGEFFCAGVGGRIAGRRADLAVIDDPIGSKEDAYSEIVRQKIWDWYNYDFRTRLKPNARVILIQTRWHEDDLAGRLLSPETGNPDEWTVINLPLLAEDADPLGRVPGEVLWPDYYTPQMVADAKKDEDVFNCLYQQNPTPKEGNFFKRDWIEPYLYRAEELPRNLRFYCASDHAVSLKQEADLTCLLPVGVDENDVIYVLPDLFWTKADSGEVVEAMVALMKRRKPHTWWAEAGHISKSIGPFLTRRMQESKVYTFVEESTPSRDKPTRAQSIRGRMKMGMVRFPREAHWWPKAFTELLAFPGGKHDDFVDALAHIGLGLDTLAAAPGQKRLPYREALEPTKLTLGWLKKSDKAEQQRQSSLKNDY